MSVSSTELVEEHQRRLGRRDGGKRRDERPAALITPTDWRRPIVRYGLGGGQILLLVLLVIVGLGPILWLAKSAIMPTSDTISHPMSLFPHGAAWSNLRRAWVDVHVGRYFWNTIVVAFGSWLTQIIVATTGGYALSVLRPRYAKLITALLLATLFVPAVVLLVPLYIEIVRPPLIHHSFIDSYWAVWLPAGASAFNVITGEAVLRQPSARDLRGRAHRRRRPVHAVLEIVLPMSKPILGVVSVFAVLASWKDFLWPLLVLTDPDKQPLGVRLPASNRRQSSACSLLRCSSRASSRSARS